MGVLWVSYFFGLSLFSLLIWLIWRWNEILYVYPIHVRCSSRVRLPPGSMGIPVFGEFLKFVWYFKILRRPDTFISSKIHKYRNDVGVYRSHLFGVPSIIVCSPSLCKLVLHSTGCFKHEWPTRQVTGPDALLSMLETGAHHGSIKGYIMGAINHPSALAKIVLQVQPIIISTLKSWSQRGKVTVKPAIKKVSLQLIGKYFPNLELAPEKGDELLESLAGTVEGMRTQPWNFPGMPYYRALKHRKKGTNMLKDDLEKRKKNAKTSTSGDESSDVMDGLMRMKSNEGKHLTDEEVLDNVFNLLEAGYVAVTYPVIWGLYLLAKSPHILQKLREENMGINKENNEGFITLQEIRKLTYTNKVVEEIIRMANIVPFVFWRATEDIEHKGYLIPKGWQVILWLRNLHIDSANFTDPMHFNPDRWDTRPRYGTYLPFGGGPRTCPGDAFTRTSLSIFLHYLSTEYRWELVNPDTPIKHLPFPEPEGLRVSLTKI